jgi:NADPH-dependent 2,4-dienoyl-CoA reductase/sulfur reductase-like enzyme/nitrite reductase/ring-hydroxylating ferredoxin subunit
MAAAADKPDLSAGVPLAELREGMTLGRVGEEDVVLVRRGAEFFALGAHCTHYHGPLAEGLIVGDELRCPWHHACFSLRTGEAVRAPALDPVPCWRVERVGEKLFVRERLAPASRVAPASPRTPASVGIVGGGAAGLAAADMLRREGFAGPVTIFSADDSPPVDRPNLSKDFLAGTAPADWIPLRPPEWYTERRIELRLGSRVTALDAARKRVQLENGESREFGALLLATGADPVKLPVEGASASQLYTLRSFADSRALVERTPSAKQVVVVGASFIGLEVAASLRARGAAVHVVAPEQLPLEKMMGPEVGRFVRRLHEAHGVVFHLGETVARAEGRAAVLSGGARVDADFIVLGVGVRPSLALAERAGLNVDRGVLVDAYLETSAPHIFAAGDIARWPDAHSGERLRIEHWVVAERQGQVAARNILGARERFADPPFFWSQHYEVTLRYVGHAEKWDAIQVDGDLDAGDCALTYTRAGRTLAVATIGRDLQNLQAEAALEARA